MKANIVLNRYIIPMIICHVNRGLLKNKILCSEISILYNKEHRCTCCYNVAIKRGVNLWVSFVSRREEFRDRGQKLRVTDRVPPKYLKQSSRYRADVKLLLTELEKLRMYVQNI